MIRLLLILLVLPNVLAAQPRRALRELTPHQLEHLEAAIADMEKEDREPVARKLKRAQDRGITRQEYERRIRLRKGLAEQLKQRRQWPEKLRNERPSKIHDYLDEQE